MSDQTRFILNETDLPKVLVQRAGRQPRPAHAGAAPGARWNRSRPISCPCSSRWN